MLNFSTKAQTLENIYNRLSKSKVLYVFRFLVTDFQSDAEKIIMKINESFKSKNLIIRSSAFDEDGTNLSNAGRYLSILNVPSDDFKLLKQAIDEVIASYDFSDIRNEVFVQEMLEDIEICGVSFTADIDTLAQYYVINYDETGHSSNVTAGISGSFKTYIQVKDYPVSERYPKMKKLIQALQELEILYDNPSIDVEFAITTNLDVYILQVRPISTQKKEDLSKINIKEALYKVYRKVEKLSKSHPNLLGHRTVFGVMPDWNPAEIIGFKPKQLSISLYKELVTDSIWAFQRDNYGYRNLRSHPLLVSFLGVPFIDVRVDFNSFIPKSLDEDLAGKLAEYYIDRLIQTPSYHDKVEFEIIHSCYYFNLPERLSDLSNHGFSEMEIQLIEQSLLELTNSIINEDNGIYKKDIEKINVLARKYDEINTSELPIIDKIYWLLEDCKRYGTLPFAGIARAAFIATQILRSMIEIGIISKDNYNKFLNSFDTITSKLQNDLKLVFQNKITKEVFLEKYGHLRPGTYDILSLRYDENFNNYFTSYSEINGTEDYFSFSPNQHNLIEKILKENRLKITFDKLISFIKEAIESREYSKYIFTRSLSRVLQLVGELGSKVNITREDMAFADIKTIMNLYAVLDHRFLNEILENDIKRNKEAYQYTKAVKFPSLIIDAEDVYGFYLITEEPNFITLKKVQSQIICEEEINCRDIEGKIVFIQSADPGYDFLFSKKISGLITQFGGANSHMAVRCAETGVPAVIGAGEKNYNLWKKAKIIEMDCLNKLVKIIN